jgi:hypothetical protein
MPLIAKANDASEIFAGTQEKGNELVEPITNTILVLCVLVWMGIGVAWLFSVIPKKWMVGATVGSLIIGASAAIAQFTLG